MTAPVYHTNEVTVYLGDCLTVLPQLADNSVDSVVTDPPYGLDFMGKHWDIGAVAFDPLVWKHCRRVLKPGGHLLAFGGTRTHHRLACAIEDAGFEIRDSIAWLYGSGFPKSLDVSKAIDKAAGAEREVIGRKTGRAADPVNDIRGNRFNDVRGGREVSAQVDIAAITAPATDAAKQWQGWGTALKPAHEPIVVARKPLVGTVAQSVQTHGTGALNIDATRVGSGGRLKRSTPRDMGYHGGNDSSGEATANALGRWPTNVVIDNHTATQIDAQSGNSKSSAAPRNNGDFKSVAKGYETAHTTFGHDDEGGASRFFPTFKYEPKAPTLQRPTADGIAHPTVKPLDLMRWLVKLVTPPHGLVLDPFAGSGTTAEAAVHEHMRCITIEREPDYLPVITARLHKPMQVGFDFDIGEFDT